MVVVVVAATAAIFAAAAAAASSNPKLRSLARTRRREAGRTRDGPGEEGGEGACASSLIGPRLPPPGAFKGGS